METLNKIPEYLYRGDCDPQGTRKLKATHSSPVLLTNLSNGGDGRKIFKVPLDQLIQQHIAPGWNKTHFLSFTGDIHKAFHYASNGDSYMEYLEQDLKWDFKIFTFVREKLDKNKVIELYEGIFCAEFIPESREFLPHFKIMLIDVARHLKFEKRSNGRNLSVAIQNAERDKEWLLLPLSRFNSELTSKLDKGCLEEKCYKYFS